MIRAFFATLLAMLTLASSASADCAWVLWQKTDDVRTSPLKLAVRERYLQDPTAALVAAEELAADRAQRFGTVVVVM